MSTFHIKSFIFECLLLFQHLGTCQLLKTLNLIYSYRLRVPKIPIYTGTSETLCQINSVNLIIS